MAAAAARHLALTAALALLVLTFFTTTEAQGGGGGNRHQQQNIIFIVADDAGYADFQSTDSTMSTPNIRALREEGVFLNQSYVLPMCAPSRAAWMTGRYPHTFGLQDASVNANMLFWINETFTFLPRALKDLNYTTHMLGKWHLGFCHPGLTPRGRGFDSFYGFWLGSHDSYYNHTKNRGATYDWWDDDTVDLTAWSVYQTDLLNARAVKIVDDYDSGSKRPFFMYLSYGAPHGPFEVPEHYMRTHCPDITNTSRRVHCGMMAALDVGVGSLVQALKRKGIYDNTLIVFLSDNGGPIKGGSVNYPLRSGKKSLYEGGIRSYTVLRGPGFKPNSTWGGLAHAVDWFPTFVSAAGGSKPNYAHGYDLYNSIRQGKESPREDFIIASDFHKFNHTMLRWKQWKLFTSVPGLSASSRWIPGFSMGWYPPYQLLEQGVPWEDVKGRFKPGEYLLFNVEEDPQERNNVYERYRNASFVQTMKDRITIYLGDPGVSNGTYPIFPFPYPAHVDNNSEGGVLTSCWCHPTGLPDCRGDPGDDDDDGTSGAAGVRESRCGGGGCLLGLMLELVLVVVVISFE